MSNNYFQEQTFNILDFTEEPIVIGEYENCIFTDCNFSNVKLSGIKFVDCQFKNCNLSLARVSDTAFRDSTFTNCKMLGLHFEECNQFGLAISLIGCQLNHSSFNNLVLKNHKFKDCSLQEVDFTGASLIGSSFSNCDLYGAIFSNTNLEKVNFSTAFNYSIDPSVNRMKNAKFSSNGLAGLLDRYNLEII